LENVVAGKSVLELCKLGDSTIESIAKTVYNKGKVQKGIAFPTCVSPNEYVAHLAPLESDPEAKIELKQGDLVRIELGAHVDGYVSQVAHTVVVGATAETPVTDRKADVLMAANLCTEAAVRLIKPGNTNKQVAGSLSKLAAEFDCKPVEGMVTYQVQRNVLDGPKSIVLNAPADQHVEEQTFEQGEVYTVDILVSTGEGKLKNSDVRTTIYKRNPNAVYQLKLSSSRKVFSEIQKNCGTMAFSLRQLEDEKKARMGILECTTHQLVQPYQVMQEKEGEYSAHVVFTVLLMPNGPLKLTGTWDESIVKSEKQVKDETLVALLNTEIRKSKKKKTNKK
jgi:curved DNA binding protein